MSERRDDNTLEWLLRTLIPGPVDGEGELRWSGGPWRFWADVCHQACGILYERDQISLISDAQYDRIGRWLGDAAATAMDWQSYPWQAFELADACLRAWKRRRKVGNVDCSSCGAETWGLGCLGCPESDDRPNRTYGS